MHVDRRFASFVAAIFVAFPAAAVALRYPAGDLHGFPTMRDREGNLIADGELTQELKGDRLIVHGIWRFKDGRVAEEDDELRVGHDLRQERFAWIERRGKIELRHIEVDFRSGSATVTHDNGGKREVWRENLHLKGGKAFAGYSTALAVSQLRDALAEKDARAELTFVAFTPKPRTVTLEVSRAQGDHIDAAGREIAADRYTLHPKIPFPVSVFVHAEDAYLWFTHSPPPALLRAEQSLVEKDDPKIVIDVIPRTAALSKAAGRRGHPAR
jgi:hypothetical protein